MNDTSSAKEMIVFSFCMFSVVLLLGIAVWFFTYTLEFHTCNKQAKSIEEINKCEREFPKTNWDRIWK